MVTLWGRSWSSADQNSHSVLKAQIGAMNNIDYLGATRARALEITMYNREYGADYPTVFMRLDDKNEISSCVCV